GDPGTGYRVPGTGYRVPSLPADGLPLVLLVEPGLERREVLGHRARVHLALTGQRLERVWPWFRGAHFEHRLQAGARLLAAVDRAAMQRRRAARGLGERPVELKLENLREEIARVRCVGRHVILRAGIEELLATR